MKTSLFRLLILCGLLGLSNSLIAEDEDPLTSLLPSCEEESTVGNIVRTLADQPACEPVTDEEFVPAAEGMEVYDATGGTERRKAESAVVDEMLEENSLFELPAPKILNTPPAQEIRTDFGFRDRPIEPVREEVGYKEASKAVDFDSLMKKRKREIPNTKREVTKQSQNDSVEIGDIYGARKKIALDTTKQNLFTKSQQIASQCQCVFNQNACYVSHNFEFDDLNVLALKSQTDIESKHAGVCNGWLTGLRGKTSDNQNVLDGYLQDTNKVLSNLSKLGLYHTELSAGLEQREINIKQEIRHREEQRIKNEKRKSGSSGWGIAGQVLQQYGMEVGDIYAEVGGSILQDVTSGGGGTATYNSLQRQKNNYELEVPSYNNGRERASSTLGTGYSTSDAYNHVKVFESQEHQKTQGPSTPVSNSISVDLSTVAGCESEGWVWDYKFDSCRLEPSGKVSTSESIKKCQALGGSWIKSYSYMCKLP